MKKKLKVEKAFVGKMMRAAPAQARRVIVPREPILGRPPTRGPISSTVVNPAREPILGRPPTRGPISSTVVNPIRPGAQLPPDMKVAQYFQQTGQLPPGMGPRPPGIGPSPIFDNRIQPSSQIDPSSPRSLPFASAVGPSMQGVGDPRLGAATIPGNQAQMQMRGPTQAAPVQPVPAMKRGGMVRGGRAEIKGTRPAKLS